MYQPKLDRALEELRKQGKDADDLDALAFEYDKLGGLITLDGEKVENGVFYKAFKRVDKEEEGDKGKVKKPVKKGKKPVKNIDVDETDAV